jgi:outer membrane protein assembly factor BamA
MNVSGFGRNYASMVIDQSTQRSLGGSVSFSRPLRRNTNFNLGFMGERTTLADYAAAAGADAVTQTMAARALEIGAASTQLGADQLAASVRANQLLGGTFFTVNPSITYDTRNAYIDATRGTYAKVSAGPSLGLSGTAFAKVGASVSKFIPLKGDDVTLATNFQAGAGIGGLPQFAQYRLGGWNGVRGYGQFTDLGVGSNLLMATAEVRSKIPFLPKDSGITKFVDKHVKIAMFADAGSVGGNRLTNDLLSRSPLGASVGVGLRIKVPMLGLMRLDYGIPLINSVLGGMTPRFTVGFGDKF